MAKSDIKIQASESKAGLPTGASEARPTRLRKIVSAIKKRVEKQREANSGQVYMSSNFRFDD